MIYINENMLLFFTLFLCILIYFRAIYLRKKNDKHEGSLKEVTTSLANANQEIKRLRKLDQNFTDFQSRLSKAELTTQLQKSRLAFSNKNQHSQAPERYQYIHSLTQKGISSTDIASILSISLQEAEQLVALAGLSKN